METASYPKILIGQNNGENIYLSPPSWDCGWYWGFGYLGNKNSHYHVDGLKKIEEYKHESKSWTCKHVNLFDGFKHHFGKTIKIRESKLWTLSELFETFYTLKETAEVLGRGGSHLTSNPCADIIINKSEVTRINEIVLPEIFKAIYLLLENGKKIDAENRKMLSLILDGETQKVITYMFENSIHTDDLKNIEGITDHDFDIVHSAYWKEFHSKKAKK